MRNSEGGSAFPLLRIWFCGPFEMAWIDPVTGHTLPADASSGGRDRAAAISLLALLLCQPNRQAHRDWVMEQFWPEGRRQVAVHRLENIFSCLRKMLRPPDGGESLLRSITGKKTGGPTYCLDAYPTLWVDTNALTWSVEQAARMERFGENPLPFWERAFALVQRGPFLANNSYEAYATWVIEQRERLEGVARQCVHALARLFVAHYGEAGKSEALLFLRTYWQRYKTDEDVLRVLLELLGEQERYQEAEEYYQQLVVALGEEEPDEDGQVREPDARTRDIREYLRTKQIQRERSEPISFPDADSLPISNHSQMIRSLAPTRSLSMRGNRRESDSERERTLFLDPAQRNLLQHLVHVVGAAGILPSHSLSNSRPFEWVPYDSMQPMCLDEMNPETLGRFAKLTEICQHLSEGNELQTAERVLWSYLPRLETIVKYSFTQQQAAAEVASQSYLLAASLAGHRNDLRARHHLSEQALLYGKLAQDRTLQIAALRQLSITFDYLNQPDKVLQIYQHVFPSLNDISPLLRACVYAGASGAYAQLKQKQEALHFMNLAYDHFPLHPEHEPGFLHVMCRYATLVFFDGLNSLGFDQPREAEEVFARIDGLQPKMPIPERVRVELLNYQVEVFTALRSMEQACTYLEAAVQAALAIGSERRSQEAFTLFQQMQKIWPNERRVQRLQSLFLR